MFLLVAREIVEEVACFSAGDASHVEKVIAENGMLA